MMRWIACALTTVGCGQVFSYEANVCGPGNGAVIAYPSQCDRGLDLLTGAVDGGFFAVGVTPPSVPWTMREVVLGVPGTEALPVCYSNVPFRVLIAVASTAHGPPANPDDYLSFVSADFLDIDTENNDGSRWLSVTIPLDPPLVIEEGESLFMARSEERGVCPLACRGGTSESDRANAWFSLGDEDGFLWEPQMLPEGDGVIAVEATGCAEF